ncbi:hypothetical protein I2I11_11760 [Pontibacter sp. 172403-2]|uniref:hypothetical protein n=1 Tax=Pontibacter rufus TaxID=2791028 RepID=UPI0018AF7A86|nr:hypothetical protein [Pontibacter sp. 172403-2]MBF9253970.1 hypothetical protein [Pontibacter sp. 172403-2]
MKINLTFSNQKNTLSGAAVLYLMAFLVITAIAVQPFVEIGYLTRDPMAIAKGSFYYGMLSNIGVLLWCATATICLLSFFLLKLVEYNRKCYFILAAGAVSLFLLLDDLFMIHEEVFPRYLHLSEKLVLALYPILICWLLLRYSKEILNSSYLILLSSLGFLAFSEIVDVLAPQNMELEFLLEDGFKFMGIVGWCYYFASTCYYTIKNSFIPDRTDILQSLDPEEQIIQFS